jgi:hypothetical protein
MFPQQESHLPTAGLSLCSIITTKSGVPRKRDLKEEERFFKEVKIIMTSYDIKNGSILL